MALEIWPAEYLTMIEQYFGGVVPEAMLKLPIRSRGVISGNAGRDLRQRAKILSSRYRRIRFFGGLRRFGHSFRLVGQTI